VGAEGVQAANASDYAIGRFKFLKRLLLVHGVFASRMWCRFDWWRLATSPVCGCGWSQVAGTTTACRS
jgi:hypothetical protein